MEEDNANNNLNQNRNLSREENIIIEEKVINCSEDESTNCQIWNIKENEFDEKREEEIAEHILNESQIKLNININNREKNNKILENNELHICKEYFLKNKIEAIRAKRYLKFMKFI